MRSWQQFIYFSNLKILIDENSLKGSLLFRMRDYFKYCSICPLIFLDQNLDLKLCEIQKKWNWWSWSIMNFITDVAYKECKPNIMRIENWWREKIYGVNFIFSICNRLWWNIFEFFLSKWPPNRGDESHVLEFLN